MENEVFKTSPAVFAVGKEYQIIVPVKKQCVMWVNVGDESYYDDSNGILKSNVKLHKMSVPSKELDKAKKYTVCYRIMIERKPYFSETGEIISEEFEFFPLESKNPIAYHIADAHNMIDAPVKAAKDFERKYGKIDFLILNGDLPDHSGTLENWDNVYEIASQLTGGSIPCVFSRGNHDTRGICAENIAEYTPTENGNSYFSFRIGNIWGLVIDCGEDKRDTSDEYGNTICCHTFRKRETKYIESIIKNAENEYEADGVLHKIIVSHVPFTEKFAPPFDIEEELYRYWAKLLRESVKPELMICGHKHCQEISEVGGENDTYGQPCVIATGTKPYETDGVRCFAGSGFIFSPDEITVVFNNSEGEFTAEHKIKISSVSI